ncbi:MAG: YggU family protein [Hadesarchaea archaeon CG08_land_8_20_14_0_20_51_8]|nr:MAG: YggU family protein [Hadesarchaea archaeon CG08_land_8_20_14_0_20_51_8]
MKRIKIKVVPNAGKNKVFEGGERLKVYVTSPPTRGKANKAVIKLLAEFFEVKRGDVKIIKGEKSREKIVEINVGR